MFSYLKKKKKEQQKKEEAAGKEMSTLITDVAFSGDLPGVSILVRG